MRKQLLIVVCVAVVAFLLGTLVSMGLTANGIMPNPFEEPLGEIQIIRFKQPDEINVTMHSLLERSRAKIASFLWIPKNPQSNIIHSISCYFELRWEALASGWQTSFDLRSHMNVSGMWGGYQSNDFQMTVIVEDASDWTLFAFQVYEFDEREPTTRTTGSWVRPNQENYNITMVLGSYLTEHFPTPTYLRNINVIMEVIDG